MSVNLALLHAGLIDALVCKNLPSEQPGDNEDQRSQNFEQRGKKNSLLAFRQTFGCKGALDDLLVGGPVEEVEKEDSGKEGRPVQVVPSVSSYRTQMFGLFLLKLGKSFGDSAIPGGHLEGEKGNHQPTDEKAEAIEGVRDGDRAEAPEDCVGGPHYSNEDHDRPDGSHFTESKHFFQVQHSPESLGAKEEHKRKENQHVGYDEDKGREGPSSWPIALLQELRNSRDPRLEVARQKKESEDHKGGAGNDLPCHDRKSVSIGIAI